MRALIGPLTVDGGNTSSDGGGIHNSGTLTLIGSTLSRNSATSAGGGIYNNGMLAVTESTLSDNSTGNVGGGIYNSGTANVTDSTLSGNSAVGAGGGIYNDFGGTLSVTDSTLSGNSAVDPGGGGIANNVASNVTITGSTLSGNNGGTGGSGGGITNFSGTVSVAASIVADGTSSVDCSGSITDAGYNLDDDGSCGFTASTDFSDTRAGLYPGGLQNNGGPTQTIALEQGSPALGAVNNLSLCSTPDQRGVARPTPCDIGAVELVLPAQTISFTSTPPLNEIVGVRTTPSRSSVGLPVIRSRFRLTHQVHPYARSRLPS
jgi:hypothetical protein